ncbi:hypothetical protein ACIBL5_36425 [Streptomyces sp. NPDC050516]|uniref:hypothetical protein n=1 Tax=Streptomyces sp. NPDC050516 TaxID=3365621 RepID=UPI0037B86536
MRSLAVLTPRKVELTENEVDATVQLPASLESNGHCSPVSCENNERGELVLCPQCRMAVHRHWDVEGNAIDLDLRQAPIQVPEGLRWRVSSRGTAINLGWNPPTPCASGTTTPATGP